MLKAANETCHKSVFDRMDRMVLGFLVVRGHPVILLSCLISVVILLSWFPVSGLSNVAAQ